MLKFLKFLVFLLLLTILIKGLFVFASKDFFKVVIVKVEGDNELIKFDITEKILQIKDSFHRLLLFYYCETHIVCYRYHSWLCL